MAEIEALFMQEYSTNLAMLSQQRTPKLANLCTIEQAGGNEAFRMLSQVGATEAIEKTTSAMPAPNIDMVHEGRWVYPKTFVWGTVVDVTDTMKTKISPNGAYTMSAIAALNRTLDDNFLAAFFGDAATGKDGSTTTSFDSNNQIATTIGDTTGMNVDKLRAVQENLLSNDVDIEFDPIYIGISPKQNQELMGLTQVISTDFNLRRDERPVLMGDRVMKFLNMNFIISTRLPKDDNDYRRCPVWTPSGMGRGSWQEVTGSIRKRPELALNPDYIEATMMQGFTRIDEDECHEIKCAEV